MTEALPEPTQCRVKACPYLTRRPSRLCPSHERDVNERGVADPDELVGRHDDGER